MTNLFRKARPMEELLQDRAFSFHVGQLMGAAEMASHWLKLREDPEAKAMGEKLAEVVGWFFTDPERPSRPPST